MFVLPDTIAKTVDCYVSLQRRGRIRPGFVAPLIPVNGVCYRWLLDQFDLVDAFESRFGPAVLATAGEPIQTSAAAARWMWEHFPLETIAAELAQWDSEPILTPIQFSIGLIVFERAFWELMGMYPVFRHRLLLGNSTLGADEAYICKAAVELSRPGVVTTSTIAGHFSFGPQYGGMLELLREKPALFEPRGALSGAVGDGGTL